LKGKVRLAVFFPLCILYAVCALQVFASGAAETQTAEAASQNNEWVLCITGIDSSSLPANRVNISGLVERKLVDKLSSIGYRTRVLPEYAYYEDYAWTRERSAAARSLAAKIEERSQFLFRGEPDWRYRRNIERLDKEIENLRTALETAESNAPAINNQPVFKLTQGNIDLSFPAPPQQGGESRFCSSQRVDAFLSGTISNFHGRYVLSVKLYALYMRAFVWQDSIIFSDEDIETAIAQITRKLIIVLSGSAPAAVSINAQPSDSLILINRSFAGRGETNVMEFPPGSILVTATSPNHESLTFETSLAPGELARININLNPIEYVDVEIYGSGDNRIYHGAMYVGEAPFTLCLPLDTLEYVEMETSDLQRGTVVFHTPATSEVAQSLSLNASPPLQSGRVDRMRRHYYWSWGGVWISGITAWLSYYSLTGYSVVASTGNYSDEFAANYNIAYNIHNGSLIALGVTGAYCIYRLIRYLHAANRGATRVASTTPGIRHYQTEIPETIEIEEELQEKKE